MLACWPPSIHEVINLQQTLRRLTRSQGLGSEIQPVTQLPPEGRKPLELARLSDLAGLVNVCAKGNTNEDFERDTNRFVQGDIRGFSGKASSAHTVLALSADEAVLAGHPYLYAASQKVTCPGPRLGLFPAEVVSPSPSFALSMPSSSLVY